MPSILTPTRRYCENAYLDALRTIDWMREQQVEGTDRILSRVIPDYIAVAGHASGAAAAVQWYVYYAWNSYV